MNGGYVEWVDLLGCTSASFSGVSWGSICSIFPPKVSSISPSEVSLSLRMIFVSSKRVSSGRTVVWIFFYWFYRLTYKMIHLKKKFKRHVMFYWIKTFIAILSRRTFEKKNILRAFLSNLSCVLIWIKYVHPNILRWFKLTLFWSKCHTPK
jgi:hypothetical protein